MRAPLPGRRVLVTTDAVGGVWRYAMDLAAGMAARDVEVALLGLGPEPSAAQRAEADAAGVPLGWLDARLDWTVADADAARSLADDLARRVRREGADLLHLNSPSLLGAGEMPVPTIAAAHSCLATWWRAVRGTPPPSEWEWHRRLTARGLRRAAVAIAPSRAYADALVAAYGPLPGLRVVPNGAHPLAPLPRTCAVLAAGRWWDPAKNLPALDAAAALIDWPLEAAGPDRGPDGARVSAEHLVMLGTLEPAAMAERTARAPIAVSLALYEPFGLAVLEAASAGAALVLSEMPTFRELWGGAALFVDPGDPADVARAVNGLIRDEALRRRLGEDAARRAAALTIERQVDAFLATYADALENASLPVAAP